MAIVSCPECNKKLKVADTSVGKKVKCSCGNIFVAQVEAPVEAAPAAPEKVFVACTECGAKLKVATTSLGKKMKCPKCAGIFVAQIQEEAPPPLPEPEFADDDAPPPMAKPIKKAAVDDDDLMSFAADEEEMPKPKGKGKSKKSDDDDDEPKAKPGKKPSKKEDSGKPVYPSRILLNILVTLMLLFLTLVFAVMFFGRDFEIDPARMIGIPAAQGPKKFRVPDFKVGDENKVNKDKTVDQGKDKDLKDKDVVDGKDKDVSDKDGKDKEDKGKDIENGKDDPKDKAKIDGAAESAAAKAQVIVLTQAAQAYFIKNQKWPQSLQALVERDDFGTQYIEKKEHLLDPWKKPFLYDPTGPKNEGLKPDIWSVTPSKAIIGNWANGQPKKKDDGNGKDGKKDKEGAVNFLDRHPITNLYDRASYLIMRRLTSDA